MEETRNLKFLSHLYHVRGSTYMHPRALIIIILAMHSTDWWQAIVRSI